MDDHDKIKITFNDLYDSRVDEELVMKKSTIFSQKVEKVEHLSKFEHRILIQIGVFFLCLLLIALMIIWASMRQPEQEQPAVNKRIFKADLSHGNKENKIVEL